MAKAKSSRKSMPTPGAKTKALKGEDENNGVMHGVIPWLTFCANRFLLF